MIAQSLKKAFKPYEKNPNDLNKIVYTAIATAISQYVTSKMSKCMYLVSGVTTSGAVTTPFAATCLTPMTPTFIMPPYRVKKAMKGNNGANAWPELFNQIGEHMKISYSAWKCAPAIIAFPVVSINTTHFRGIGTAFYSKLQSYDKNVLYNGKTDTVSMIWNDFESMLEKAIKTTLPIVTPVAGFVGVLPFTGQGTITFATL